MSVVDTTIVTIAIPRFQTAFGAGLTDVQWVLTAYTLTLGVVTPTTAFFADRLGTKSFWLIALAVFTAGSALCGLAWSLPALIFFRIVQAVGGAFLFPLAVTQLYRAFPLEERGLAGGVFAMAALLAPAVGPVLGGYFITYASWQLIFFINIPVGIVGLLLGIVLLREVPSASKTPFDLPGFLLVASGLIGVLYALSDASTDGWGSGKVLGFLVGGLLVLVLFVIVELTIARRGGHPLVDLRLFTNGPFLSSNLVSALLTFAFFGGFFLVPVYWQNLRGLSAYQTGLLLLPFAFASMVAALVGGRLVDRIGVRWVVLPGMLLLAYSTWQFASVTLTTPYWQWQLLLVVRGVGFGLVLQPLSVAALSRIRPERFPLASSLYTVIRFVFSSLGVAVLATLVQTQTKVHYTLLAELVTPASRFGQSLIRLQTLYLAQGADRIRAGEAAIQQVIQLIERQAAVLAIQDAFWLSLLALLLALIPVFFVPAQRLAEAVPTARPSTEIQEEEERELEVALVE
jgi:EmrB/QacA subfamily drug resistance transporter